MQSAECMPLPMALLQSIKHRLLEGQTKMRTYVGVRKM